MSSSPSGVPRIPQPDDYDRSTPEKSPISGGIAAESADTVKDLNEAPPITYSNGS